MIETLKNPDNIPLTEAGLGQTVILNCNASGFENGLFFWYKMNYGYMVQTVATGSFGSVQLEKHFENSTFKVNNMGNMHYLTISNVSKEDEATYLCQAGGAYKMVFVNGTNLAVNGKITLFLSSCIKSVSLGTEVTLQCSLLSEKKKKESTDQCTDEHNVFWFRAESESNPGFT
uniref:Ig-like domain-containing protein n=1 Tax=Fundulus heteroclitus TaxID=8078 RepID=A0A3Q2PLE1_FUNHE